MLRDRPMYAYEIKKSLKDRFDFSPATVTVYVVLYRLLRAGVIRLREEAALLSRPERKYYEITEEGQRLLEKGIELLRSVEEKLR
jgi:DNA-binding PadR family transcriptional regulator